MSESKDAKSQKSVNESKIKKKKKEEKKKKNELEVKKNERPEEELFAVIPPNGGWGWIVVLSAFYCNIVVDGIQLTFGIFLNVISKDLEAEISKVALAGSLMFGVHLLMGPVCSGCNSVFGLRPVTITGSLICSFGIGISYFAKEYWFLYFSFGIIGGIGLGLVYMNTLVITSLYFTSLMPIAIGIVVSGSGLGTMIFAGMGSFLLKVTTWQMSFLIQATLAGSMSIFAITFKPLKPVEVKISNPTSNKSSRSHLEEENRRKDEGESSSKEKSLFIKKELQPAASTVSLRNYQNLGLNFIDVEPEIETEEKRGCGWSKCCRKRKSARVESKNILVLMEIPNEDPHSCQKSYVEKTDDEDTTPARDHSTASKSVLFMRIVYKKEPKKREFWSTLSQTIVKTTDCRLLSSCSFFIFTLSGAISLAAYLIVFMYEKDRGEYLGFSEETSVYFLMTIGGVNVFWRLFLGAIAVIPNIHYWALAICGMIMGGVGTMFSGYNSSIYFQFAFCFVFGLGMASFAVFRMPLLIDLVGMDFLENAAGITLLFTGVCCIAFPPIFGWLKEVTHSYNLIFMLTGGLTVVSALMLIGLKKVDLEKIKKKNAVVMGLRKFLQLLFTTRFILFSLKYIFFNHFCIIQQNYYMIIVEASNI